MNAPTDRPLDPATGEFIERRVRTGTIADRRDAGTMARKKWSRVLNITFVITASLALVMPAIASSYFGISVHKVVSNSMYPVMNAGDMFLAKISTANLLKEGDIVLLMNPETWEIQSHRVIEKKYLGDTIEFTTKGDANVEPDAPYTVGINTSVRTVSMIVPKFGYVLNALATKEAKLTGLAALILMNIFIVGNVLVKRRKTDPKEPFFPKKSGHELHEEELQLHGSTSVIQPDDGTNKEHNV
jgi:signal peptidase I